MSFNVRTTAPFERSAKALAKRYRSLKSDLSKLIDVLERDPLQGVEIGPGVRKIRMTITSKGRGKAGGARVITYTVVTAEADGEVYLIDIYDKSEFTTVDTATLLRIISDMQNK